MSVNNLESCKVASSNNENCSIEVKNILKKLKDYKGYKLQIADTISDDLLNDKSQQTFQEGSTIEDYEKCSRDIKPEEIKRLIGAVSPSGFKETFQFSAETNTLSGKALVSAAKLIVQKKDQEIFDSTTQKWLDKFETAIQAVSGGGTIDDLKKTFSNDEIYGTKGVLNLLLAVSRISDVLCNLDVIDRHKVSLAIGARASLIVRNPVSYGPKEIDDIPPYTAKLLQAKSSSNPYFKEGFALQQAGKFKEAARNFEYAINLNYGVSSELDAIFHFHAASCLASIGDPSSRQQALNHLRQAEKIEHGNQKLKTAIAQGILDLEKNSKP